MKHQLLTCLLALGLTVMLSASLGAASHQTALDTAFEDLARLEYGSDEKVLSPIWKAVTTAEKDKAMGAELERRLMAVLESDAPNAAKDYACRCLKIVGSEQCVPALAALLPDPELSGLARFALEMIPGTEARKAMRQALPRLKGRLKIGVISSLGDLQDGGSVGILGRLLKNRDPEVAAAAAYSLGKIGTHKSAKVLEGFQPEAPTELQPVLWQARLECADVLLQKGRKAAAAAIFTAIHQGHPEGYLQLASFRGLVYSQPRRANRRLLGALRNDDTMLRGFATQLVVEIEQDKTPEVFIKALPTLPPQGQVALLTAVGKRADTSAHAEVVALMNSPEPEVRLAALETLSVIGNASDVSRLTRLAAETDGTEQTAASTALANLPGPAVDQAILDQLASAPAASRVVLLNALPAREATGTAESLLTYVSDPEAAARDAAIQAIGKLGSEAQIPPLIVRMEKAPEDQKALLSALAAICGRVKEPAADSVLNGLGQASGANKVALLKLLNLVGGERSLNAVRRAAQADSAPLRDAAIRELTGWSDTAAIPDLVKIVQTTDQVAYRVLALRGYVRLVRTSELPEMNKLRHLNQAMGLADRNADKILVMGALGDLGSIEALKLVATHLDQPELANEAGATAVKIATRLGHDQKAAAGAILQEVIDSVQSGQVAREARKQMNRLGVSPR